MPATLSRGAAAALVLVATACSGGAPSTTAPPTAASAPTAAAPVTSAGPTGTPTADAATDRAAVEKTLADYNAALLARDFGTACGLLTPQAAAGVVQQLAARGAKVSSCEQAFAVVYAQPGAPGLLDSAARTTKVDDVAVSGDVATVTYSGDAGGQHQEGLTSRLQRIDGRWRVMGNG